MAKKSATRKPNAADVVRLGEEMATFKANNPRAWRAMVKTAHARGFTVAGQFSGVPDPLKERTQSSLKKQALSTVNAIYKPQEAELDMQEKRNAAIAAKRASDEAEYQRWLATQQDAIVANAKAADAQLAQHTQQAQAAVAEGWTALQQQARDALAKSPGAVSDPAQARALDLSTQATKANADLQAQTTRTNQSIAASGERMNTLRLSSLANGQAQRATISADERSARNKIAEDRYKLKLNKSADAVKESVRLQSAEVDKANANREFMAAADKLGLETQKIKLDQLNKDRQYALDSKKLTLAQLIAEDDKAADEARIKVRYDEIAASQGQAAADRALKRELEASRAAREAARQKTANKKLTAGERRVSADAIRRVSSISRDIQRLHAKKPKRPIREILASKGASDIEIDVANDLWRNKGKLSAAGRRKAKSLGIIVPSYWIP